MTVSSTRHRACNRCRNRKVKCDGERPCCKRCSRLDGECVYASAKVRRRRASTSPPQHSIMAKSTAQGDHSEDAEMLTKMLSMSSTFSSTEDLSTAASGVGDYFSLPAEDTCRAILDTTDLTTPRTGADLLSVNTSPQLQADNMHYPFFTPNVTQQDLRMADMAHRDYGQGEASSTDVNVLPLNHTDTVLTSATWFSGLELVPPELLDELHRCYFMTVHRSFPMIDWDAFLPATATLSQSSDTLALRYAMCAHAANSSPKFAAWAVTGVLSIPNVDYSAWFYREAGHHLECSYSNGQVESSSIVALQATILIALYELRLAQFSRAWATTSRATWLAQALHLHKLDPGDTSNCSSSLPTPPPTPTNSDELDEARRTLWAVLTLNSFMGVGVSWNIVDVMNHNEISTYLPREDPLEAPTGAVLRLNDALRRSAAWPLSSYQGVTVAAALCARTVAHVKSMNRGDRLDQLRYNFWTQHCHLDELIRYVADYTSNYRTEVGHTSNANEFMLDLMLKAMSTCLHEAVIAKAEAIKGSHPAQVQLSEALSLENAIDIAKLFQTNELTETVKANIFLPWTIYVALQALIRRLNRSISSSEERSNPPSTPSYQHNTPPHRTPIISRRNSNTSTLSTEAWTDASALDSMSILRSIMLNLKSDTPLAAVFNDEIAQEIAGDELFTKGRPVGLVNFPSASVFSRC